MYYVHAITEAIRAKYGADPALMCQNSNISEHPVLTEVRLCIDATMNIFQCDPQYVLFLSFALTGLCTESMSRVCGGVMNECCSMRLAVNTVDMVALMGAPLLELS